MKKAFSYMFLDNKFYKKTALFLIYTVLLLYCSIFSNGSIRLNISNYIVIKLVVLFGYTIFIGYNIAIIKYINDVNENISVLPILNLKKNFVVGIKYFISLLVFFIPFFCIIGASAFAKGFASGVGLPDIITNVSNILCILSIFVWCIYLFCFLPASILIYAKTGSIWSFYKFDEIFGLISVNKKEYAKIVFIYSILGLAVEECHKICFSTSNLPPVLMLISLLILACIIIYLSFSMNYVVARINKI